MDGCRPAQNMPPGYLDGQIAGAIDAAASAWRQCAANLPPLPAELEARTEPARASERDVVAPQL